MKKLIALILVGMMCLTMLAGCGGEGNKPAPTDGPQQTSGTEAGDPTVEPIKIRSAYSYNANTLMGQFFQYFQDYATELSGGAITFDPYWGSSLIAADDALDSIGTGVADIGNGLPVRTPTLTPFGPASFYFPFRPENLETTYEVMSNLMTSFPEFTENVEQYNIKLMCVLPTPGMQLCSTKPIQSYKDLKGMKVAAAGADYSIWDAAGAVVVSVAGDARYENLQRSIVDASYLDLSSIYADHSYEVAPYVTYTGLGDLATVQFWANADFWSGLSDAQRDIMEQAMGLAMEKYIDYAQEYLDGAVAEMEQAGVTFYTLSAEDKAEWASVMENLPQKYAANLDSQGLPGTAFVEAFIKSFEDAGHVWNRDWLEK